MVGRIGDVRTYPRKEALERDIRKAIANVVDGEVGVGDIYVIGSWGRGNAMPRSSDLDVIFIVQSCEPDKSMAYKFTRSDTPCSEQIFEETMTGDIKLPGIHPRFDGVDLIPSESRSEFRNDMVEFLRSDEPNKGYNLTEREDVYMYQFI